jgi:serine/threonine protein kinase
LTSLDPIGRCPRCGARLALRAGPALCPACVFSTLFSTALVAVDDVDADAEVGEFSSDIPYQIVTLIGRDAEATTYLAHPLGTTRRVALKIFEPRGDADARGDAHAILARFAQWKGALAHERYPGIARLLDVAAVEDGRVYFASEYVAGSSLSALLRLNSLVPADRVSIATQIVNAIDAVHAKGLAHMALAASRVRITTGERVRATILGLGTRLVLDDESPRPDVDLLALVDIIRQLGIDLPDRPYASASAIQDALRAGTT